MKTSSVGMLGLQVTPLRAVAATSWTTSRVIAPAPVAALNQKTLRLQGFMMPLDPGERQTHFLLSSVPLTCSFCVPGGPESMVEVKTKTPVKYSMEPVVVEGRFSVLHDDAYGLYYRMIDATPAR